MITGKLSSVGAGEEEEPEEAVRCVVPSACVDEEGRLAKDSLQIAIEQPRRPTTETEWRLVKRIRIEGNGILVE